MIKITLKDNTELKGLRKLMLPSAAFPWMESIELLCVKFMLDDLYKKIVQKETTRYIYNKSNKVTITLSKSELMAIVVNKVNHNDHYDNAIYNKYISPHLHIIHETHR